MARPAETTTWVFAIPSGAAFNDATEEFEVLTQHHAPLQKVVFSTCYDRSEFGVPVPRELLAIATAETADFGDALMAAAAYIPSMLSPLAFASNAWIGDLGGGIFAWDSTPGRRRRRFFEAFTTRESGFPSMRRPVPPEGLLVPFLDAIGTHPHQKRLHRAMGHYSLALRMWKDDYTTPATAELFMAVEALAKPALEWFMVREGVSEEDLCKRWGVDTRRERWREHLVGQARLHVIFNGDAACHKAAKEISDGWEHGYASLADLHKRSYSVRDATARYLRASLLKVAAVPPEAIAQLTSGAWQQPMKVQTETTLRVSGWLEHDFEHLMPQGSRFPYFTFPMAAQGLRRDGDRWSANVRIDSARPHLADGVRWAISDMALYMPKDS